MSGPRCVAAFILFACVPLSAETHRVPLLTATASSASIRYAGFGEIREMRCEVFDGEGDIVFDSAFTRGNLLEYPLTDRAGLRLDDGLYLFIITIRDLDEGLAQKFGTFRIAGRRTIVANPARDRLSAAHTRALAIGARAALLLPIEEIGVELPGDMPAPVIVVSPDSGPPAAPIAAVPRSDVAGTGTTNKVTKWTDTAGTLGDSAIAEVGGRVGIGTMVPGAQLHIFGTAGLDVFAGMGPNLTTGPAMNFGYSGASFGRGSGFFNVRPDASAVPPNPSLRFLTGNVQQMIITNTGNIGIGTLNPTQRLEVFGSVKLSGGGTLIFPDTSSMSTAGATLGANSFSGNQHVTGTIESTGDVTSSGGAVDAFTQFNLGGQRILSSPSPDNLYLGIGAGANASGARNVLVGPHAGESTTGADNSMFGVDAGRNTTTGTFNSFFGADAGAANVTGSQNSFFGTEAGMFAAGGGNSYFGTGAGMGPVGTNTGTSNAAFGNAAGTNITTGSSNALFGQLSGAYITTAGFNTFAGERSGFANVSGMSNTFVGHTAGEDNQTGALNTYLGASAGQFTGNGTGNTFIGAASSAGVGLSNATAIGFRSFVGQSDALVLGSIAGVNGAIGTTNVGIGTATPQQRLDVIGNAHVVGDVIATGPVWAGTQFNLNGTRILTTSGDNLVLGPSAGFSNPTGSANTFIGSATGSAVTTGSFNTFLGAQAGVGTTTGSSNTLAGAFAGVNLTNATDNSFFGFSAGSSSISGNSNAYFGSGAGGNNTGSSNSFYGRGAGSGIGGMSDGSFNSAFGQFAGQSLTSGANNSFFGNQSGFAFGTGDGNTFIGSGAGSGTTEGSLDTALGSGATVAIGLSNATAIGASAYVTQSNSLVLGSFAEFFPESSTKVGIGTSAPKARLEIKGGSEYISTAGSGITLTSSNGMCWLLTALDGGTLSLSSVTCPP